MPFCMPDSTFRDSTAGVYPLPYDEEASPEGGIPVSACINEPFAFTFTVKVDSMAAGFPIDSLAVVSVDNMPIGLEYACDPPGCSFPANSFGCAIIVGTATDANPPGDYDLMISAVAYSSGFELPLTFPNPLIAPGNYFLTLNDEGGDCINTSTRDIERQVSAIRATPNPFTSVTNIAITSLVNGDFQFRVHDLFGKEVHRQTIGLFEGENTVEFDGSDLPSGVYVYSFSNGKAVISDKLMINR